MSHGTGTPCAPSISPTANLGRGLRPVSLFMHGFREASFPLPVSENPVSLIANAQKTPFAQMCKGRMSRGTTFSYACLSRISQGSFNVDRTGRLTVKFSLPVQKLPSIPAFLQIPLSLSGISLWRCSGMYSSFSQPFSFFAIVCIIAEDFSFVKREFSSVLRYMPRSHLFPAWSRQKKE